MLYRTEVFEISADRNGCFIPHGRKPGETAEIAKHKFGFRSADFQSTFSSLPAIVPTFQLPYLSLTSGACFLRCILLFIRVSGCCCRALVNRYAVALPSSFSLFLIAKTVVLASYCTAGRLPEANSPWECDRF